MRYKQKQLRSKNKRDYGLDIRFKEQLFETGTAFQLDRLENWILLSKVSQNSQETNRGGVLLLYNY